LAGRPSDQFDAVADRLDATTFPLDLSDADAIEASCESSVDVWRATFDVNVFGPVALTLALLPALKRARGQVVLINSGAGLRVSPGMASNSASKLALRAFADSLRQDEPELRVTTVYPGRTDTEMQREIIEFSGGEYDPSKFMRPETGAAAVATAVTTPRNGQLHEVIIRPSRV
jgi:NADP-dependent 3-hydroxy acid dehydrogenase YdfG